MNDAQSLLGQLKIDRGPETGMPRARGPWIFSAIVIIALLLLVSYFFARGGALPVAVATAAPLAGAAGGAASLLDASGYVVARRQATVSSKITGKLQELYIEEGQSVAKGEVLARLDDSNALAAVQEAEARVAEARAGLAAARAAAANAEPIYQRDRRQAASSFISAETLDRSKSNYDAQRLAASVSASTLSVAQAGLVTAQRNLADTVVRAPFAGVVTTKAAQPGEIVSPISAGGGFTRTGIGTLVDMDSLEVEVDVNENFINRVQGGRPATVKLNAYPDWDIPAEVIAVIPTADRSKATVKVRVGFKSRDPRILPEMGARVSFLADQGGQPASARSGVTLPEAAVQRENPASDTGVVYVISGDRVERRAVRLGSSPVPDQLAVLSGLRSGDRVAIGDFSKLRDGLKVKLD